MIRGLVLIAGIAAAFPAAAVPFDVAARREALQTPDLSTAREACLAPGIALDDEPMAPVAALGSTEGYGSDNSIEPFAWRVMVLAGRALAGDAASGADLGAVLDDWASAGALIESPDIHDTHFALKRALQPIIIAYSVIGPDLGPERRERIAGWIDTLVRKIDITFDGDVDLNNHRYLADAVLASWGAVTGDKALLDKGEARLREALTEQMRPDGSFPLEARRGARAIWYHRQSLASLTVILAALRQDGRNPLREEAMADAWIRTLTYFADTVRFPRLVIRYASENYIPGPSDDFRSPDMGFLDQRGHGRHYLAWIEAVTRFIPDPLVRTRIAWLRQEHAADERPLIDDFSGGAITCFWWQPGEEDLPGADASGESGEVLQ